MLAFPPLGAEIVPVALPRQDSGPGSTRRPLGKLLRLLLIKAVVWSMAAGAGCSREAVDSPTPNLDRFAAESLVLDRA